MSLIGLLGIRSEIGARLKQGLKRYIERHKLQWVTINLDFPNNEIPKGPRYERKYQAAFGMVRNQAALDWLRMQNCPVVQYAGWEHTVVPNVRIMGDDHAIGVMAAKHLVEQGYRSFACIGAWDIPVRARRYSAFVEALTAYGYECAEIDREKSATTGDDPERAMAQKIAALPRPVALFFYQDSSAAFYMELCAANGLRVPEDVAILGVENLREHCESARTTLSSIDLPWEQISQLGALELQRMMARGPTVGSVLVPPLRVVTRQSTARPKIEDPLVSKLVRMLERKFSRPFKVAEAARSLGVTRGTLHRRFDAAIGCSVSAYLHRLRIEKAQQLLISTDLEISAIATRSGYGSRQQFHAMFHDHMGISPSAFRSRYGLS